MRQLEEIKFRKLDEIVKEPKKGLLGFEVFAFSVRPTGHTPRIVIGQRTIRKVFTGLVFTTPGLYATGGAALLNSGVFIPGLFAVPVDEELVVPLLNGGNETFFLEHGQLLCNLHLLGERRAA